MTPKQERRNRQSTRAKPRGVFSTARGTLRRALGGVSVVAVVACFALALHSQPGRLSGMLAAPPNLEAIANAITELDVAKAQQLLSQVNGGGDAFAFQRARLSIYVGDCDSAEAILKLGQESAEVTHLAELAQSCARATAGGKVVEDREHGVWIRLQDAADEALVPYLVSVATKARDTMVRDIGVDLPRPLRIDLVRDLFSLAAVSGLPVEAAETTGTVAIARWGRITMLSPRAAASGYPWEDTLAHEITHLALARGSRDFAPLWLQEGIAKREEVRWRQARPFDDARDPHQIAREALLKGTSVGIDRIGPSIAMLPTPEAAAISYAEVQSFMDYWIQVNGTAAFTLLLADLKGLGIRDTDPVLLSLTGYPLRYWIARWQQHLRSLPDAPKKPEARETQASTGQKMRLGDLLMKQGAVSAAADYFDAAVAAGPTRAAARFRAAGARLVLGQSEAAVTALGNLDQVSGLFGSWLGVHARLLAENQRQSDAEVTAGLAIAVDPLGVEAACDGYSPLTWADAVGSVSADPPSAPLPVQPTRRRLCEAARAIVRD